MARFAKVARHTNSLRSPTGFDLPLDWRVDNMPSMTTDTTTPDPSDDGRGWVFPTRLSRLDPRWVLAGTVLGVFAIDQITKELAIHALSSGPATLGGLHLHLVANTGILMGFPAPTSIIVLATIGVVIVALRSARGSRLTTVFGYGLLAGGALGNLADRFQDRRLFPPEAVVDWISVGRMTFNLADTFLIAGVVMLALLPGAPDSEKTT